VAEEIGVRQPAGRKTPVKAPAPSDQAAYRWILVVKLADIGDVLTATPALRALRQTFPLARLDILVPPNSAPVLHGSPLVDEILRFDKFEYDRPRDAFRVANLTRALALGRELRARRYDTVVILHHLTTRWGALKYAALALSCGARRRVGLDNGRGWFLTHRAPDGGFGARHEVEYWLDVVNSLGAASDDRRMAMTTSEEDEAVAGQVLERDGRQPAFIIHPGSGGYSLARRWDPQSFAVVADALAERRGARIILVGTVDDDVEQVAAAMRTRPLVLLGQTTLGQLAALLRRCDLFIGADSGIMHLAAAAGTPLVAIFGPSNHHAWGPWSGDRPAVVLRSGVQCSPCSYVRGSVGAREGCSARTCMRTITPEVVLAAAEQLLDRRAGSEGGDAKDEGQRTRGEESSVHILGVRADKITYDEALARIEGFIAEGSPHQVVTVNPEFIMASRRDFIFRQILDRAALAIPDGVGLLWAARWLGCPLAERVAGVDMVERLAAFSARRGYRLFFLGAAEGVAERAIAILQARYSGMAAVGAYAGSPAPEEEEDRLVEMVRTAQPDVLFVAYGAPAQDKWIARNLPRLGVPVCMGVGGAFDFIAGVAVRAPRWMQRLGLEWLHRLGHEPWRWRRMLALPAFALLVLLRAGEKGDNWPGACQVLPNRKIDL
jgi:lipopolysaccharide heptosyltransferase II